MPVGFATNGHDEEPRPVAIVALANALLDMSISVDDDTLVHFIDCKTWSLFFIRKYLCFMVCRYRNTDYHLTARSR